MDSVVATALEPRYCRVPRCAPGSAESIEHLHAEGFVVIADALTSTESTHALDLTWDYLGQLGTGIERADPTTWGDDRWPVAVHGGIIPSQGIGHSSAQWYIRSIPNVKTSFAAIWDDDDLLVSFDGMALWRPPSINPDWRTNRGGSWLHVDQHPIGRPGFHCVQGLVTLLPTSPTTGGNVIIPRSHRLFESIPERYADRLAKVPASVDHFRYPADDPQLVETPPIMPHLEAGDLLLWDSRTIHCSSPGPPTPLGRSEPPAGTRNGTPALTRAVSLVCMMPRAKSSAPVIERRRRALASRTSTTNWSDRFINADKFPEVMGSDRTYRLPPEPELDPLQQALVG